MAKKYTKSDAGYIDNLKVIEGTEVLLAGDIDLMLNLTGGVTGYEQVLYTAPDDSYYRVITKVVFRDPSADAHLLSGTGTGCGISVIGCYKDNWGTFAAMSGMSAAGHLSQVILPKATTGSNVVLAPNNQLVLRWTLGTEVANASCKADVFGYYTSTSQTGWGFKQRTVLLFDLKIAYPAGVALDTGEYLYVSDTNSYRIVKILASDFSYVAATIPSNGSGDSQLKQAQQIVSDGTHLYVCDTGNNRIVKLLCSDLSYVAKIGTTGSGNDNFTTPRGIATATVSDTPYLYITDTGNNRIVQRRCDTLAYVNQIGTTGSGNDNFNTPVGICSDGTYLYIADSVNNRIVKRNCSDLAFVSSFGTYGSGISGDYNKLYYPKGVSCDTSNLCIADSSNNRIIIIKLSDFTFVAQLGVAAGYNADQFFGPEQVAIKDTHVYVANSGASAISDWQYGLI